MLLKRMHIYAWQQGDMVSWGATFVVTRCLTRVQPRNATATALRTYASWQVRFVAAACCSAKWTRRPVRSADSCRTAPECCGAGVLSEILGARSHSSQRGRSNRHARQPVLHGQCPARLAPWQSARRLPDWHVRWPTATASSSPTPQVPVDPQCAELV